MSDTDDTDSLLSAAAPKNLRDLLNPLGDHTSSQPSDRTVDEVQCLQPAKGELLGQPVTDCENVAESDSEHDSENDTGSETGSQASTASTNSITMFMPVHRQSEQSCKVFPENPVDDIDQDAYRTCLPQTSVCDSEKFVPFTDKHDAFTQQKVLEFTYDKLRSPNYGVRVSPGFGKQGIGFLKPSPQSGWRYLPGSENEAQIFTRAPNFRTPGGYKPSTNTQPPRSLSDQEILDEVRKMYAFPDGDGEQEQDVQPKPCIESTTDSTNNHKISPHKNLDAQKITTPDSFDRVSNIVPDCVDGHNKTTGGDVVDEDKCVKKNLTRAAGDTVGSIPDLGFGLRDLSKLPVKEPPVVSSNAWVTERNQSVNSSEHSYAEKATVSKASARSSKFDETNIEISPTQAAYLEKNEHGVGISRCLPRMKQRVRGNTKGCKKAVNLLELDLLWREIQQTKVCMEEDIRKSSDCLKALSATCGLETDSEEAAVSAGFKTKSDAEGENPWSSLDEASNITELKPIVKAKKRNSGHSDTQINLSSPIEDSQDYSRNADESSLSHGIASLSLDSALPLDLDNFDVDGILSAAKLRMSDFEDILSRIDDGSGDTWEEIQVADDEIESAITSMEVTDWAKSGAKEYLQKYHDEKLRRQHCETEIASLQSAILQLKEEAHVRDKASLKKDEVLLKMTKAWSEVTKQWKSHEKKSRNLLERLQTNQIQLSSSLQQSKSRIEEYEKELSNSVELASSFKKQLEAVEESNADIIQKLREENDGLKNMFMNLETTLECLKVEKDAAVTALGESQKQLDEKVEAHRQLRNKLLSVEGIIQDSQKELDKALSKNKDLEETVQKVTQHKEELEDDIVELTDKLQNVQQEKERLAMKLSMEVDRQVKEESDRLHAYYNEKLHEALRLHAQQMISTEVKIIDEHRKQLQKIEADANKKCQDYKQRCLSDMTKMIQRHEKELKALRQDLAHKEGFISSVSEHVNSIGTTPKQFCLSDVYPSVSMKYFTGDPDALNDTADNYNALDSGKSSPDNDFSDTIPKYPNHSRKAVADLESSTGMLYPEKLPRYNTSTPNSALHYNIPFCQLDGPDTEAFIRRANAPLTNERKISDYRRTGSFMGDVSETTPIKLSKEKEMPSFSVLTEQSLQKLVETLDKCSVERKFTKIEEKPSNMYGSDLNHTPQKHNKSSKSEGSMCVIGSKGPINDCAKTSDIIRKSLSKPPWK